MLGNLGDQVVLISKRAFERIIFKDYYRVSSARYYPSKEMRDTKAREEYRDLRRKPWSKGEIYLMQIIDREMKRDDLLV